MWGDFCSYCKQSYWCVDKNISWFGWPNAPMPITFDGVRLYTYSEGKIHVHYCWLSHTHDKVVQHGGIPRLITGWQSHAAFGYSYIFDIEDPYMINWHLSKHAIRWPAPHDHDRGPSLWLIGVMCSFKVDRCPGSDFPLGCRLKPGYLIAILLAKSIYYCNCIWYTIIKPQGARDLAE